MLLPLRVMGFPAIVQASAGWASRLQAADGKTLL